MKLSTNHSLAIIAGAFCLAALAPVSASAQAAVGSGVLTGSLATREPESGAIKMGPVNVAPGLTISEMGHDDNVFDEAHNPKEDWLIAATPDIALFTRTRFAQISAYAGTDMQWYKTYESENDLGVLLRGRVDLLLSRVSPFFGGGRTKNRTRPNGEIDTRADQQIDEASGGLAYSVSTHAQVFGAMIRTNVDYLDAFEDGVSLQQSLSHRTTEYQAGLTTALTPLLGLQLRGNYRQDEFASDPTRNGESRGATAVFTFDAAAVVSGTASIGYQDYTPVDPLVQPFRGITGSGFIVYPFLEIGRFSFGYNRSTEYSFDTAEAYYLENTFRITYTQRLIGQVDLQGQAGQSYFDYGHRAGTAERRDRLESYNGNLGYNLRNRTRIAANYEYARRQSPDIADRNYIRRRIFLTWMVAF
jgi:hypothetical protein